MRIGGAIERPWADPDEWGTFAKELGYRAVLSPVDWQAGREERRAYADKAKELDLVIGEVGAWKNALAADGAERREAIAYCENQLALAEELGANCCVNISGSGGDRWDGFSEDNYRDDTRDLVIETVRRIIDAVKPKRTFYTIESMPWMVPDSPDEYLALIRDVDRPAFGAHLDFVNMITSPRRYAFRNEFVAECFAKLGPWVKSVHGKDVTIDHAYPVSIREVMPGEGTLDYRKVALLCEGLGPDTTLFVEHLPDFESYRKAAAYVRAQAALAGVAT